MKIILVFFMLWSPIAWAESVTFQNLPLDMDAILAKISVHELPVGKVIYKIDRIDDGQNVGLSAHFPDGKNYGFEIIFNAKGKTLIERHRLHRAKDMININIVLVDPFVQLQHGFTSGDHPRLVFFNSDFVFVYGIEGQDIQDLTIKQWIYVRKPNDKRGTRLIWQYKPDVFGWPLTIEADKNNQLGLFRNIPVNGVKFSDKKKREHAISIVKKVFSDSYFPAHEKIGDFEPSVYWTQEGVQKTAFIRISDEPFAQRAKDKIPAPPGKKGPDWSFTESFEQNTLELIFPSKPEDYPLLID